MKLVSGTQSPTLTRWGLGALSALAADELSRNRQAAVVEVAFGLCQLVEGEVSQEQKALALEAACLLANLVQAKGPRAAFEKLGGTDAIMALSGQSATLLKCLEVSGLVTPRALPVSMSAPVLMPIGVPKGPAAPVDMPASVPL